MIGRNEEDKRWGGIIQWILLAAIVLMIVSAIAYFFFGLPIKFIPIIFIFPLLGGGVFCRK